MGSILMVDDSDTVRREICGFLRGAGHTVVEARDGAEGLKFATEQTFDLVLTDLNMPNLNGIGMVKEIRKLATGKTVPVFMLTTEASSDLRQAGKDAGVMVWIVKPAKPDKLLGGIEKVLSMAKAPA